jgi:NDP-sugar pyrophosphorylase family protein
MKAIIMAGGKGTRLLPYSALFPKPLMPLGDMPILELLLRRLREAGIDDVVLAVNHLRHLIEAFFGDGERFGLRISYSVEHQPLGTAGPMAAVLDTLGEDFLLTNGDLLTTLDVEAMIDAHRSRKAGATIGAYARQMKSEFGVLEVDGQMNMTGYREKPTYSQLISMGVYVLNAASVRPYLTPGQPLDMPDLVRAMVADGRTVYCHQDDCFWLDIGRPDDFALAQDMYQKDPDVFLKAKKR